MGGDRGWGVSARATGLVQAAGLALPSCDVWPHAGSPRSPRSGTTRLVRQLLARTLLSAGSRAEQVRRTRVLVCSGRDKGQQLRALPARTARYHGRRQQR